MTVEELIAELKEYDSKTKVFCFDDGGYIQKVSGVYLDGDNDLMVDFN